MHRGRGLSLRYQDRDRGEDPVADAAGLQLLQDVVRRSAAGQRAGTRPSTPERVAGRKPE